MAKKLLINADVCDLRSVAEETLAAYENVMINTDVALVNERAKALLARYAVAMNCDQVLQYEGEVQVRTVNGELELGSGDGAADGCAQVLIVNGRMQIPPEGAEAAKSCLKIIANGAILCPRSLAGKLNNLQVNGTMLCYPDGAVVLKSTAVIDRMFALRAKQALYWAAGRLVMVDPALDAAALAAKGARFSSRRAIVAESLVEGLVPLLDEGTEIVVVPDGTSVVRDDLRLNRAALRRHGTKLYVVGDLTLDEDSRELLPKLEYLNVHGDVELPAELEEDFAAVDAEYSNLVLVRGKALRDRPMLNIDARMLQSVPQGISAMNCGMVTLNEDVTAELIAEKLVLRNCGVVNCSAEQSGAVAMVSENVGKIVESKHGDNSSIMGLADLAFDTDQKIINADQYVM